MPHPVDKNLSITDFIKITIKGLCMGVADVIPGVSGGTIAFLTGIYEQLIEAIKSFDLNFIRRICTFQFKQAFDQVAWKFLLSLGVGLIIAILTMAKLLSWLLEVYPIYVNSFFFGLILATVPIIGKIINKWNVSSVIVTVVSAILMYFLVMSVPVQTPNDIWFLFFCGALAISAMILPGISGAFILVLLGKYQYILQAVNDRNFIVIAAVGFGVIVGICFFVRVLSILFHKYHDVTVALLTGLVIGSLNKIWPWKETLQYIVGRHGEIIPVKQTNILPEWGTEVWLALIVMIIGFGLAIMMNSAKPGQIKLQNN